MITDLIELYNFIKDAGGKWILCPLYTMQNCNYNLLMKVEEIELKSQHKEFFITIKGKKFLFRNNTDLLFDVCGEHFMSDDMVKSVVILTQEEAAEYLNALNNLSTMNQSTLELICESIKGTIELHKLDKLF